MSQGDLPNGNGWQMGALDIDVYNNFEDCEAQLHYVLDQVQNNNPFLSLEWLKLWWEHFGSSKQLCILLFRHKTALVGFAPFYRGYRPLLRLYQYHLIGSGYSSYLDMVCVSGYEDSLCESLLSYFNSLGGAVIIYFRDINNRFSRFYNPILNKANERGNQATIHKLDVCPLAILGDKWEEYVIKKRDGKSRYKLRKYERELSKLGEIKIREITDSSEIDTWWPAIERVHNERFKNKGLTLFMGERRLFLMSVLRNTLGKQASLSILEFDDTLVSFLIGFHMDQIYIDFTKAFDPAFTSQRLGHIHLMHFIPRKMKEKFTFFDFSKGGHSYKREWSNDETTNFLFRFGTNVSKMKFWYLTLVFYSTFYSKYFLLIFKRVRTEFWKKIMNIIDSFVNKTSLFFQKRRTHLQEISISDIDFSAGRLYKWSYKIIKNMPPDRRRDIIKFILKNERPLPWIIIEEPNNSIVFLSQDYSSGYRLSF